MALATQIGAGIATGANANAQTYYPSCVVNLTLRLDESLQVIPDPARAQQAQDTGEFDLRPSQARTVVRREVGKATSATAVAQQASAPWRTHTVVAPAPGTPAQVFARGGIGGLGNAHGGPVLEPLVIPNSDNLNHIANRVPKSWSCELNGVRQAWKFNLTFDFRDFPIDPRLARAISVEIHVGTVSARNFAEGQRGRRVNGRLMSQLPTRNDDGTVADTLVMYGTADRCKVQHGATGSTVEMEGRDLRGLLLDAKVPMSKLSTLNLRRDITLVVADILAMWPTDMDMDISVAAYQDEWDARGGIPSPVDVEGQTAVRLGADGEGAKATPQGGQDRVSYWGLIVNYCFLVGAVPYLDGRTIWIRPARNVFDLLFDRTYTPPFADGRARGVIADKGEERLRVRRFVYGRDLEELSFERKYAGTMVPIIEVVSLDDSVRGQQRLLIVQWPPEGSAAARIKAGTERMRVPVGGIRDKKRLLAIAQDLYEEIGRGEMGGAAATKCMASFGGDNADPDVLRLRPTDGSEIVVDARALASRNPNVSEVTSHEQRSFAAEVATIAARLDGRPNWTPASASAAGGLLTGQVGQQVNRASDQSTNLARALVATARGQLVENLRYYRVSNVHMSGDEKGVAVSFDFQNYIIARHHEAMAGVDDTVPAPGVTSHEVQKNVEERDGGKRGQTPGRAGAPVARTSNSKIQDENTASNARLVRQLDEEMAGVGELGPNAKAALLRGRPR